MGTPGSHRLDFKSGVFERDVQQGIIKMYRGNVSPDFPDPDLLQILLVLSERDRNVLDDFFDGVFLVRGKFNFERIAVDPANIVPGKERIVVAGEPDRELIQNVLKNRILSERQLLYFIGVFVPLPYKLVGDRIEYRTGESTCHAILSGFRR